MRTKGRGGFTLIELIAGLTLAGVLFTSAVMFIDQLRDGRDRLLGNARRVNRDANGLRMLAALLERADTRGDSTSRFAGWRDSASFTTWCDAPGGWLERCNVRLRFHRLGDTAELEAVFGAHEAVTLVRSAASLAFAFQVSGADAQWSEWWGLSPTLPNAVALVVGTDTVMMRAGGRR